MNRSTKTHKVTLPNGEERLVIESPDYESRTAMIYTPKKLNGDGYGVCCDTLESAILHMFQTDCDHNVIVNDVVSPEPKKWTPLPYKCTKCNKHFIYWEGL